jgi:hypothetical protein
MNELKYVIFDFSEVYKIDFNEVKETSIETLRISLDESKTFVKYEGDMPLCVENLINKSEEFTHSEIIHILSTSEWTKPIEDIINAS